MRDGNDETRVKDSYRLRPELLVLHGRRSPLEACMYILRR